MKIIKTIDELYKVIDKKSISDAIVAVIGHGTYDNGNPDFITCYDWYEDLGMDDLDQVEFIMNLEKITDFFINDDVAEIISQNGPNHLINNIVSVKREKILNDILK